MVLFLTRISGKKWKRSRPFAIELDDGRRFIVNRPEALMFPSHGNTVFFHDDGNLDFVDCEVIKQFVDLVSANAS